MASEHEPQQRVSPFFCPWPSYRKVALLSPFAKGKSLKRRLPAPPAHSTALHTLHGHEHDCTKKFCLSAVSDTQDAAGSGARGGTIRALRFVNDLHDTRRPADISNTQTCSSSCSAEATLHGPKSPLTTATAAMQIKHAPTPADARP